MRLPSIFEQHARIFKVMELNYSFSVSLQIPRQKYFPVKDSLPGQYFFIDFDWLSCAI